MATKENKREIAIGAFTGYAKVLHEIHGVSRDELVAFIDQELTELFQSEFTGTLSGQTIDHIMHSTSWGTPDDGGPVQDKTARAKILAAPLRKRGYGWQARVSLTSSEAESLIAHLDIAAGVVEGMTHEERSGDTEYRAMRKDCERWQKLVKGTT